jgi:hypothetical protein
MKKTLSSAATAYRKYRAAKKKSRVYRAARYAFLSLVVAYVLLLCFPQVLFGHQISSGNLTVYSREALDQNMKTVLDRVQQRLAASPINSADVKPRIFLTNSFGFYSALSLYIGTNSFGKGYAALNTDNVFINKSDAAHDLVFRNAPEHNQRSLSGVIAHEVTHLLIRKRYGYWRNLTMPAWKKEGYAEYIAGGATLDDATGTRMWKANPRNDAGYQYFKYYRLVKYLLEHDRLSVDELFSRNFDMQVLEERVLKSL